jgi:hypothetical protein
VVCRKADIQHYLTLHRELYGVSNQIDQHLAQPRGITS